MPLRIQLFRKVTIIGVGLIGGSIGLAIKKHKLAREVVGISQRHSTLMMALKNGAIDHAYHDIKKAVLNADLVILATPVSIINGMFSMIAPHIRKNCIVTDVGSAKLSIVNTAQERLPNPSLFVGAHPLAGSEKKGVQFADPDLFRNSLCIITPTEVTNRSALERIKKLWIKLESNIEIMSPEQHDSILSYISHLPHLVAYALMETIPNEYLKYAAQGLKDTTRVASSSPQLWSDIFLGNKKNIINDLDYVVNNLSQIRKCLDINDSKGLVEHFKTAKIKRDRID